MSTSNAGKSGNPFRVGLVQMGMSPDADDERRQGGGQGRGGRSPGRPGGVSARALPVAVFLPARGRRAVRPGRDRARPQHRGDVGGGPQAKVAVVVPIFERRAPGLYHNSAVIIDETGDVRGLYRKMHIPDDPAFYEKFYFTPGDLGFRNFDVAAGRIGTLICWDQWYPEGARLTALQGAAVLFYPDRHRLAPAREGAVRRRPARRLEDHPAQPRHRQRRVRGGGQPGGPRAGVARASRAGVLGHLVPVRSLRRGDRRGVRSTRRRSWSARWTSGASRRCGATGRSCAIGASTPTGASSSASWIA